MEEIGIESSILKEILDEDKTIEGRLGTDKFLKLKTGDTLTLREDVWKDGVITESIPNQGTILIRQILYFSSFKEMLESLDIKSVIPSAKTIDDALAKYQMFYSPEVEEKYGVIAFVFELI